MTSKKVTRKWEVFAGRNKFLCDGRLITAPHNGVFYLTVFLITSTSILFFVFDCPFLATNITIAIPCIGGVLFIFTMGTLLRTSFSDPGIIPRAAYDEASYIEKQIEVPNSCNSPTLRPPPRTKEVLVRGQPVKLKYCYTCKIFRPPRASHCSLCDNCVDRFDHHCPWVGNCVGKRNYRFFYMFIVSLAFLAVYIFACGITHLVLLARDPPGRALLEALRESPASAVVCIICFLSVWSVLGLAGFHTYLITTDQTTNEDIKGSFSSKHGQESPNPYSRGGVCSNCWHVLCGPVAPSLIDRRGVVTNEFRGEITVESQNKPIVTPPVMMTIPTQYNHSMQSHPSPVMNHDYGEPIGTFIRPLNDSCSNLYRLDEKEGDGDRVDDNEMDMRDMSNVSIDKDRSKGHLYSNVTNNSHYMNHQLDLDPVVLTGSKRNLIIDNENMCHHVEMCQLSSSSLKLSVDPINQNVTYTQDRDGTVSCDEMNHNNVQITTKNSNGDIITTNNNSTQTWADRLPTNENRNDKNNVTVLSASKLRLLHDTTMIDTALDLDSLDGSTVSLWPANV